MDSLHEAHLSRILDGRRRRGVLGDYTDPIAAPPPRPQYVDPSPPPPPRPPPPPPPLPPPRRVASAAGTQTAAERKLSAAAQTTMDWSSAAAGPSDWRQSAPRNGGGRPAAPSPMMMMSPPANATQGGAVRFESPGRVPSLAYTTPASSSSPRGRRASPWQAPASSVPVPAWGQSERRRSVEPLPPPLYIPQPRPAPRESLRQPSPFTPLAHRWSAPLAREPSGGGSGWRPAFSSSKPAIDYAAPSTSAWRTGAEASPLHTFSSGLRYAPLSIHRDDGGAAPLMAWPSVQREASSQRRRPSRHRSHHRRHPHRHHHRDYDDDGEEEDEEGGDGEVEFPPRRRGSRSGAPFRAESRRRASSTARPREGDDVQRGRGYAPPVVYMGHPDEPHGTSQRRRSPSQRHRTASVPRPVEEPRKTALGLPDARSTMDLRTSIETLRAGDWFYKWSAKGDVVHRRWVWIDTKSYLLVWSNRETRNANFCGDVRLDHICQVTSRDLTSVDEDGFPKTYYVLLIETTKRVLQLATELKDKCDAWFEAMNNVMGFIHRNDIAKGALMPD